MTNWYVGAGDNTNPSVDPTTSGDWSTTIGTMAQLLTHTVALGDTVFFKDTFAETLSANYIFDPGLASTSTALKVISVDVNDTSVYKKGAQITTNSNFDIRDGNHHWFGIKWVLTSTGVFRVTTSGSTLTLHDCTVEFQNAATRFQLAANGNELYLYDCDIGGDGVTTITEIFQVAAAHHIEWHGGSVTGTVTNLLAAPNGAGSCVVNDVDLSNITGTLIQAFGSQFTNDDLFDFIIKNCILSSGVAMADENFLKLGQRLEVWNSDDTTGDENHRFFIRTAGGDVESETSVVRTATQALPGGEKLSMKVTTSSVCSQWLPLRFNIPVRYASTGAAAEDTITVFLTSASTLTDSDVVCRLIYPDGTIKIQANIVTNASTISGKPYTTHPFTTGSGLTTTSSLWTNPATNQYKIDLSTTGDAGLTDANVAPQLEILVTKASVTIYFDSQVDLS